MERFSISSAKRCEMIPITEHVAEIVSRSGIVDGTCIVFVPHTTAAVTINEQADPAVVHDVLLTLERHFPKDVAEYRHREGNSDAHVKAILVGSSETILIEEGRLVLGTWQGIFFCEFDGPRTRSVNVSVR